MPAKFVIKSDGSKVDFDRSLVLTTLTRLSENLNASVRSNLETLADKVVLELPAEVSTKDLTRTTAEVSAYMTQQHYDYGLLGGRIVADEMRRHTSPSFSETVAKLHQDVDARGNSLLSDAFAEFVAKNAAALDEAVNHDQDLTFNYFAIRTLEKSYLLRYKNGTLAERPQYMFMRTAACIHQDNVTAAIETYKMMSAKLFTHATPTLFNAGTRRPQMSSCFLLTVKDDSIEGIYKTLAECAAISKSAGGLGVAISNVRASGSKIWGCNGTAQGLVPMLRVFNDTARFVEQGGGKRKGSIAVYLEPWHADVYDFLDMRKNHGNEEQRGRDLFYGLWIPDLFMERVAQNGQWTLFCPNEAMQEDGRTLCDMYGEEFRSVYEKLEREGKGRKSVKAQHLWFKILEAQMETGTPYMVYKDAANKKSNQKNIGLIRSSNLCTEILEVATDEETAVCNLASIALPELVSGDGNSFDFAALQRVTKVVTRNLNKVIDLNFYPVNETKRSNSRHRPIGLGVQGLADVFMKMRMPYESAEARQLNIAIFEAMYYAACEASMELAKEHGAYETFRGSPASNGELQFDLWGVKPSDRWDWAALKAQIQEHGMRNSLLIAPMPTASTAQILGNTESFEPLTQNIYVRRVLSGEFVTVNRYLVDDLKALELWDDAMVQQLIAHNGSVQNIAAIPEEIKQRYKTVWEIKQRSVLDMAADRGAFIDQSQSLNIHMVDCTNAKLSSMHFHGWRLGLKTGQYYLRTKAAVDAVKVTVDVTTAKTATSSAVPVAPKAAATAPADSTFVATPQPVRREEEPKTAEKDAQSGLAALKAEQEQRSRYECVNCSS